MKKANLEWYVLNWDFNTKKVITYNIFTGLTDEIIREIKNKRVYNKSILREYLKTQFMYNYWSRAEYEFFVSDLHSDKSEKVDIWQQIEPNLNNIVDYVNIKMDLNFK
jgi:hypothetical protein